MTTADRLYEEALELSADERGKLAHRLICTTEFVGDRESYDAAWAVEIERRLNDKDGVWIPWQELRQKLFKYATPT